MDDDPYLILKSMIDIYNFTWFKTYKIFDII